MRSGGRRIVNLEAGIGSSAQDRMIEVEGYGSAVTLGEPLYLGRICDQLVGYRRRRIDRGRNSTTDSRGSGHLSYHQISLGSRLRQTAAGADNRDRKASYRSIR